MSAADRAYRVIRDAILTNAFAQGERLTEEMLVDRCGVSRTPVREALRRLLVEGFVEAEPRQSARVARWSWDEIKEVFDLRVVLESHAARLAAVHATRAQLEALRAHAAAIEEAYANRDATFEGRFTEANTAFHRTIVKAARSPRLAQIVSQLAAPSMVFRTLDLYSDQAIRRSMSQHRELIAALEARDEDWAEAVMRAHLRAARERVVGRLAAAI
ncbi:MAG: GntR family transcriptional regulator [Caulobacterales bacterium]|nr:GntR family transcriptional regulator [Caulobacterales bacterium]